MEQGNAARMAAECESIGRNCEFGIVQNRLGVEHVSLLQWSGAPMGNLIEAIENSFEGLMETAIGKMDPPNAPVEERVWWLTCSRYGILFHTHEHVAEFNVSEAAARVRARLRWLAAKFMDDLRACEKILVYSSADLRSADSARPLVEAIRRVSLCPVLIAVQIDGANGRVRDEAPGVWIAEMPRLTELGNAVSLDFPMWVWVLEKFAQRIGFN